MRLPRRLVVRPQARGMRRALAAVCARARGGAREMGVARLPVGATKGRRQLPVCRGVHWSDDETTTVARLCATLRSWRWTRMTAGTHWPRRTLLTSECQACSAASVPGAASAPDAIERRVETWPALYRGRQPSGDKKTQPAVRRELVCRSTRACVSITCALSACAQDALTGRRGGKRLAAGVE